MRCGLRNHHHAAHGMAQARDAHRPVQQGDDLGQGASMSGGNNGAAEEVFWFRLAAFPHAQHVDGEHRLTMVCKPPRKAVAFIGKGRIPVKSPISAAMNGAVRSPVGGWVCKDWWG